MPSELNWRVDRLPDGDEPLVVVDDVHPTPNGLVQIAATRDFRPIAPHYPGVRAPIETSYLNLVLPKLGSILKDLYGCSKGVKIQECFYSLVTTRPDALTPMQRLPHIDGSDPDKIAILHYLCGAEHGGTSFYRHRATGMARITQTRFQTYRNAVYADVERFGQPQAAYPDSDNEMYERIAFREAQFNRIIIYRGLNLHAVSVGSATDFSANAETGRLTINTFLSPAR